MPNRITSTSIVTATVEGVLPELGLAYLSGDDERDWTVTRSTRGVGLESLSVGQHVTLTIEQHRRFSLVREYVAVN